MSRLWLWFEKRQLRSLDRSGKGTKEMSVGRLLIVTSNMTAKSVRNGNITGLVQKECIEVIIHTTCH